MTQVRATCLGCRHIGRATEADLRGEPICSYGGKVRRMFWEEVAEPCPHGVEQRAYRYWTGRELQVLRRCHAEGGAWARRAGVALLRTPRAVRGQAKRMGLSKRAGPRRFSEREVERAARALGLVRAASEAADGVAAELGITRKAMGALVWRHGEGQEKVGEERARARERAARRFLRLLEGGLVR